MTTKVCIKCSEEKELSEFHKQKGRKDGRNGCCKRCRAKQERAKRRDIYSIINKIKQAPCTDCGKCFPPECMDFDHLGEEEKVACVATMARKSVAISLIQKEISKCELVCACCHTMRTAIRSGWGTHKFVEFVEGENSAP